MTDKLILTPLKKAVSSLSVALAQPKNEFVRDAVIQRFEYTYELCWKFIRRDMIGDQGSELVNSVSRRDLFRLAADKHIIPDPAPWFEYHRARNETSHTYNEKVAEETYIVARGFCSAAQELLAVLEKKHAGSE